MIHNKEQEKLDDEQGIIEFENNISSFYCIEFPLDFEFSDATCTLLIK